MKKICLFLLLVSVFIGCDVVDPEVTISGIPLMQQDERLQMFVSENAFEEANLQINRSANFDVRNISIDSLRLKLSVSYPGGCQKHQFKLITNGIWDANNADLKEAKYVVDLLLLHEDRADNCQALILDTLVFDFNEISGFPKDSIYFHITISDIPDKNRVILVNSGNCDPRGSFAKSVKKMVGKWRLSSVDNLFVIDAPVRKVNFEESPDTYHRIYHCDGTYNAFKNNSEVEKGSFHFEMKKNNPRDAGTVYLIHKSEKETYQMKYALDELTLVFDQSDLNGPITTYKKVMK